jgi:hypothetical protein
MLGASESYPTIGETFKDANSDMEVSDLFSTFHAQRFYLMERPFIVCRWLCLLAVIICVLGKLVSFGCYRANGRKE